MLFSAARPEGAVRELLARLLAAGHTLCADHYVVGEALRNLDAKAPGQADALHVLLKGMEIAGFDPTPLAAGLARGFRKRTGRYWRPPSLCDAVC